MPYSYCGTGGANGSGGANGTGGAIGSGGASGTGGANGTGGTPGSGGAVGSGGVMGSGGLFGTGGTPGTGGATGPTTTRYEAENAVLMGVNVTTTRFGYSGTGHVTGLDMIGDRISVTIMRTTPGPVMLSIGYAIDMANGNKTNDLYVNNVRFSSFVFNNTAGAWGRAQIGNINLNAGNNTIELRSNWGWMDVDYFEVVGTP